MAGGVSRREARCAAALVLVRIPGSDDAPKTSLCTDSEAAPLTIIGWYVQRWSVEVAFAEARRHLGVCIGPKSSSERRPLPYRQLVPLTRVLFEANRVPDVSKKPTPYATPLCADNLTRTSAVPFP